MKWFKHISDSLDDPFIQDLMDEFGSDGYVVFFGTLEILSREFDVKSPGKVTVSHNYFRRKLRLSWHKCSTILKFCEKEGRFFVSDNGRKVSINCPKFKDMCDDWTNRQLRSKFEVAPKKHNIDKEEEDIEYNIYKVIYSLYMASYVEPEFYTTKKGRKLNGKRLETFLLFWDAFGYKKGKAEATDVWIDMKPLTPNIVKHIVSAAEIAANERPGMISQGRTPKMAQGWLTARRWEDEIDAPIKHKIDAAPFKTEEYKKWKEDMEG